MTGEKNEKQDLDSACLFEEAVREERLRVKQQLETAQAAVDEQIESSLRTKERMNDAIKTMNETIAEYVMSWHTGHAGTPDTVESPDDSGSTNRLTIEAMKIHWKGQLERLTTHIDGQVENSRAFWIAMCGDICERIKTCAFSTLCDLSTEQSANRQQAILNVYSITDQQLKSVAASEMDEILKQRCMEKILGIGLSTVEQISECGVVD